MDGGDADVGINADDLDPYTSVNARFPTIAYLEEHQDLYVSWTETVGVSGLTQVRVKRCDAVFALSLVRPLFCFSS